MAKHNIQKLFAAFPIVVLCASFPLILSSNSWAQNNSDPEISASIQKFREQDFRAQQDALRDLERAGRRAIPALIKALEDKDWRVRLYAAHVIGTIGSRAKQAVPALSAALKDEDRYVRSNAAQALGGLGPDAKEALPSIVEALKDQDKYVRYSATKALYGIGVEAKPAVPSLIEALKDRDKYVRYGASAALGAIGPEAKDAVPTLLKTLKDEDNYVRYGAADALKAIGSEAKDAVPGLIEALEDQDKRVRATAVKALGAIHWQTKSTVPALISALNDRDEAVRSNGAIAIGAFGFRAKEAIPKLIDSLQEDDYAVRSSAAYGLGNIASSFQDRANSLSGSELNKTISNFEDALKVLEDPNAKFKEEEIASVRRPLIALKAEKSSRFSDRITQWINSNKILAGLLLYFSLLPASWLALLWLRPLWLLKIDEALEPFSNIQLTGFMRGTKLSLRSIILLSFFSDKTRVLDAWVAAYIEEARKEFKQKDTIERHSAYVPLPVTIDGKTVTALTSKDLRSTFSQKQCNILIWGEGGVGKTSLAAQIAHWAMADNRAERLSNHLMLPILIEEDLDIKAPDKKGEKKTEKNSKAPLLEAIRGQLQDLTNETKPVSEELLERLLQEQRLLIIVDHFSELNELTRGEIKPESPDFPINSLIVTSRFEEKLGRVNKTTMIPVRIEGKQISSFMKAYLDEQGKRDLFTEQEVFNACDEFVLRIGNRSVTGLLFKLYTDLMLAAKEDPLGHDWANSMPDIMLKYINELNRDITEGKIDNRTVQQDIKAIAWQCLKQSYCMIPAKRQDILAGMVGGDKAEERLKYIENRLRLIQTIGLAQEQVRFNLEPLAEYLAGLHLLDINGESEESWREFMDKAAGLSDRIATHSFLLAVRDCCICRAGEIKVPNFVTQELNELLGIAKKQEQIEPIQAV